MLTLERIAELRFVNAACADKSFRSEMEQVFDAAERALLIDELLQWRGSTIETRNPIQGFTEEFIVYWNDGDDGHEFRATTLLDCLRQAVAAKRAGGAG